MAETLTDKLKLSKRDTGDLNWGQGANANLDALDAHAQQATLRPPRTLLASLGSGAAGANLLGSTTYFYKVTAFNAAGETTEGKVPVTVEAQVTESASPVPIILSWETVKGATGYKVYKSTASGQEKFLASVSGESTLVYTDDGNTAVNGAISVPASNTARTSVSKIVAGANITVSPPDGTGDVTVNATVSAPADASDTVKGVAKLSVAPAVSTNPIAVGDNDSRNTNARTPTGAAGGDLSGTYPNPTVAKVNGTSVPASPSAGQVLTATGPTAATWQTPAAGGAGYSTTVVAAPTGVAATDTANIQNAINGLPAAGGAVILREGTYVINAQISLPSGKAVAVFGQGRGTVLADAPSTFFLGLFKGPASGNLSGVLLSDFLVDGTNGGSGVLELSPTGTQVFENVKIHRVHGNKSSRHLHSNPASGTTIKNVEVAECETNLGDILVLIIGSGTAQRFTIRDNKTFNDINKVGSVLWLRGEQHVIEGNQFYLQAGTIGEGAIAIRDSLEKSVIQGNAVRYQGLLAFIGFTPAAAVFRHNVVADNVNHDVDPLILKSIVLTGKGEVSNNVIVGNKLDLLIDLPTASPSGGNIVAANKASSVNGGTSTDVIASTFTTGVRVSGQASPLTGDVKLEPGSGIGLTQDGVNNKINIAYTGPQGYMTVIVAAPTLIASTDTANIQAALDALSSAVGSAGGGTVILREGDYVVNQIIIRRDGTRLIGSGPGWSGNSQIKSGSRIRGNNAANNLVKVNADQVTVENVTFVGFSVADGFSIVEAGADFADTSQDLAFLNCAFTDIRSPLAAGIRAGGLHRLRIRDCLFFLNESVQQSVARTPIGIKIGQAAGSANLNIEISRCHFRHEYLLPTGAGTITAKDIEMTKVLGGSVMDCHSLVGNAATGLTHIFCELKQDGGTGKGVVLKGNNLRRHNNFIKQTGAFTKVAVNANAYTDHQGTDPAIDLASGNTDWAMVGNVIEAATGINFQVGADTNMAVANKASVTDSGSGNVVASSFVTGLRKLGEVSALLGDVKLEAGAGITLTQDAPNNKITVAAAGGTGNWTLVANLTNTAFGQTFTPDFTGLSLATHRSYMLMFELSLSSGGAGPNWVALRLNGAAPTTLQQYMLTDQQGVTQDDEGATNAMAKILKVFPGGGSSVEVSGCIIITGKVNSGFPHAVGWYTVTNQSAVEQMHRGSVGLRMNLGSGVDLTSLGLFSNADLSFLVAGSCRMSLYQAQ